jgi:hypothetical protein
VERGGWGKGNFKLIKGFIRNVSDRWGALLVGVWLTCLYLDSFIFPCIPIYQGDTAPIYLLEARKMLDGQMIYRDFFQFTLPGTQVVYCLLFKLFGVRAWIPSATLVVLGIALASVIVAVSRQVLSGRSAYLPSLLFLAFGFVTEPDPTHRWFSIVACMGALAVLLIKRSPARLAAAGALCGLATLFTQSSGLTAVLAFTTFLLWECRAQKLGRSWLVKAEMYLWSSFLATTVPPVLYLISKVGLERFINCTVVFLMKYWSKWYWGTFAVYMAQPPSLSVWLMPAALLVWLFIHALLPFVYVLFLVRYFRQARAHPDQPWDRLMLVSTVGVFLFVGVMFSPAWFRLISVAPPAMIVLVWLIESSKRLSRMLTHSIWAFALIVLAAQTVIVQAGWRGFLQSPTGRAALLNVDLFEKYRWILNHTRPGDYYFQADDCDQYFLLDLRNPAQVSFVVGGDYTRPNQVANVIESLEKYQVRYVMWSAWLDVPRNPGGNPRALAPLRAYLQAHYHPVRDFTDAVEEVWERSP